MSGTRWRNWSGSAGCEFFAVETPWDETDLARVMGTAAQLGRTVRPLGSGHSFTPLGVTDGVSFVYRVQVSRSPVPTYGGRMIGSRDEYARLEVHTEGGGQDYDVMGYSRAQVIHDCLDQYERHLEFLRLA